MNQSTRTVLLRHASPRKNVSGILGRGLLPWKAKGKLKAVWLHAPAQTAWAIQHVARRHGVDPADVVVFEVRVPRSSLRRRSRGVWHTAARVHPENVVSTNGLRLVG